ncbi:hypothetical protein FS842_003128 [Serendipita sp. 407]|nr:hypothetical protein FS842_003128 [Serendipita sp. 407]
MRIKAIPSGRWTSSQAHYSSHSKLIKSSSMQPPLGLSLYTCTIIWGIAAVILWLSSFFLPITRETTLNTPLVRVTTSFTNFDARTMFHWGVGGEEFGTIPKDSNHPFGGRSFGGAKRKKIRGTRAFGSGYPYGVYNQSTIAGRPFPFGVWPLYWDQNFMGGDEYGPQYDAIRPGGFIASVPLRTTTEHFNVTDDEVYYAIGDRESLLPLMVSFVTSCHATPAWPSRFNPSSPNATIKLENVIQYFRASSLALASPAYRNTLALTSISNTSVSTPLPEYMEYSPFRKCVDDVAEKASAIIRDLPTRPSTGRTIGGSFLLLLGVGVFLGGVWLLAASELGTIVLRHRFELQKRLYGDPYIRVGVVAGRQRELEYESFP